MEMKLKWSFLTYNLQTAYKRGIITKQNKPIVRLTNDEKALHLHCNFLKAIIRFTF